MSHRYLAEITERKPAEAKPLLKVPRRYKVILQNDDYTPMDFVVELLKFFFHLSSENATQVMFQIHYQGRGVCGIYTREIAETKVALVNEYARTNQHPLLCSMEPE